jgi:hypothetical protein
MLVMARSLPQDACSGKERELYLVKALAYCSRPQGKKISGKKIVRLAKNQEMEAKAEFVCRLGVELLEIGNFVHLAHEPDQGALLTIGH